MRRAAKRGMKAPPNPPHKGEGLTWPSSRMLGDCEVGATLSPPVGEMAGRPEGGWADCVSGLNHTIDPPAVPATTAITIPDQMRIKP